MKANEFIKKYGIGEAKRALLITDNCSIGNEDFVSELECLIQSHELVEDLGGLDCVKFKLGLYESASVVRRLEQAIADVESCQ